MKKFQGTCIAFFIAYISMAQIQIRGTITDNQHHSLSKATVSLLLPQRRPLNTISDINGNFLFSNVAKNESCILSITYAGKVAKQINFISDTDKVFHFALEEKDNLLEPLEVKAVRASDRSPFTKINLSKLQIAQNNQGQDIPFVLNQTPSVTVTSDAGNGVGYTGIRIRGTDASRINVTLNGIPYNDAESQGTYFVDLPDILSSTGSIQIQRGVGTSTNGAGAFGATINLSTNETNKEAYASFNNSFGSFNTWKNTVNLGSGLINNRFTVDARLSKISSNGYVDRASSNLQSYYISGAYLNDKSTIRFNTFSGKEKTYQSWYGIDETTLGTNRTFNPAGTEKPGAPYDNQTDNYTQTHYQLFFNQEINAALSFNIASFLTKGKGYYEEYKGESAFQDYGLDEFIAGSDTISNTDLVRQLWLDNSFYGQTFALQYKKNKDEITLGGSWTQYDGNHFGKIVWARLGVPKDFEYYRLKAQKRDFNIYAKWLGRIDSRWNAFADIQFRKVGHEMFGFRNNPSLTINRNFNFLNPKAGLSYFYNGINAYLSYAVANKEPNRDDFEAGTSQQPLHETLHDIELGFESKKSGYSIAATLYYMAYLNQLVLTGRLNDVGSYTRVNTPRSYRSGLEIQGEVTLSKWLNLGANATFSRNKIKSFTEYIDNYDDGKQQAIEHRNTDISFSPGLIGNGSINMVPFKNTFINLMGKYVSSQFLDNTQNKERMLKAYYSQDIRMGYAIKNKVFGKIDLMLQVNNLFNSLYEPNGYTYPYIYESSIVNENYFYPMAGTNFMLVLNIGL